MAEFAIRAPSIDDLLDPYSAEPFERVPLREEVRDRILSAWIDTREDRPTHLSVELPESERSGQMSKHLVQVIRNDLAETCAASKTLRFFTRSERREALVAFGFLVVCLVLSTMVDEVTENSAVFVAVSQGLVVLGWVAMWQPAQQVFSGMTRRLNHRRYVELSAVPIEIRWV